MSDNKLSQIDYLAQTVEVLSVENEALRAENARLREALKAAADSLERAKNFTNFVEYGDAMRAALKAMGETE